MALRGNFFEDRAKALASERARVRGATGDGTAKHPAPKSFAIGAIRLGVMSYFPLTDEQAAKIARRAYRSRKWTRKDEKKVHYHYWIGDRDALALLG